MQRQRKTQRPLLELRYLMQQAIHDGARALIGDLFDLKVLRNRDQTAHQRRQHCDVDVARQCRKRVRPHIDRVHLHVPDRIDRMLRTGGDP